MRILWVGRKFDGVAGGVERMSIRLMNALVERGHRLHLLTWDLESAKSFYTISDSIEWHRLNLGDAMQKAGWSMRIRRQFRIWRLVNSIKPDAIVAFQHGAFLAVRLATLGTGIPVIASERNAPQRFNHIRAGKYRRLIFLSFLLAKKVTVQFEAYRDHYPKYLQSRLVHIPNPVDLPEKRKELDSEPEGRKSILFVGHFEYQKNPKVLLEAFAKIAPDFSDWDLNLIGKGSFQPEMERFVANRNLQDRVHFLGLQSGIEKFYLSNQIFCLSSLWEGFPNALAEALAHGLPAVGFSQAAGVNQLIQSGENGLLAEGNGNPESLAFALATLMGESKMRMRMGKNARSSIKQFSGEWAYNKWFSLIEHL